MLFKDAKIIAKNNGYNLVWDVALKSYSLETPSGDVVDYIFSSTLRELTDYEFEYIYFGK